MNALGEAIGRLCELVLPIREEKVPGSADSATAVCTLSSMDLLREFKDSEILKDVRIAARLLSENKGIDSILDYLYRNRNVRTLVVCGREVWGHRAGHSLLQLHQNGTDSDGRIAGSCSPDPYLASSQDKIRHFRDNVSLVDMIGQTDLDGISEKIRSL